MKLHTIHHHFLIAGKLLSLLVMLFCLFAAIPSFADTFSIVSTRAYQEALDTNNHVELYSSKGDSGFKLDSSYFSGSASGVDNQPLDSATNQQLYALLIDGRYDFENEFLHQSKSLIHPYISGGMGMASTGAGGATALTGGGDVAPMFRLGGGVAYRLGQQWNMSLDYKAGTALSGGDQVFTGRSQQSVDLQSLNLGMHYSF